MQVLIFHAIFLIGLCFYVANSSNAAEGDVRLTGDETEQGIGRVEIYHDNQWGSICDDYWDIDDANIVCRQLGYPSAVGVSKTKQNGSRGMPIWLDNVRCDGIESKLIECAHNGWGKHNCDLDHTEDAFVECQVQGLTGDVYLKNAHGHTATDISGYLHIWYNNDWRQVCDPHWGITESHVVCRQLGLSGATYMHVPDNSKSEELISSVKCTGTEDRLDDCQHGEWHGNCLQNAVFVACSTNIPDSSADALYHPEKYCEKQFTSDGYNQLTLDFFRNSTNVCVDVIPANINCTKDGKDYSEFPGTVCDRRLGFTCFGSVDYCKGFSVSITCPCKEEPAWISYLSHQMVETVPEYRRLYPNLSGYRCVHKEREYLAGESRRDDQDCRACTCVSRGGVHFWLCDSDDSFCPNKRPPEYEDLCYRENCDQPRVCDLGTWVVEWYIAGMSPICTECLHMQGVLNDTYDGRELAECVDCIPADGVRRAVAVVNRKIPGPIVHVCEGDRVIVKVVNEMTKDTASGITIHWHGMFMKDTPYMDGAFMVTQCPITIGESFTYNFTATPQGTHWWHSHAGQQRSEGLAGGLIVRRSKDKDANGHTYDFDKPEHTVILQDWSSYVGVSRAVDFIYTQRGSPFNPSCIIINGRGGQNSPNRPAWCYEGECPVPRYTQFDVSPKKRYRFRVISNAVRSNCGMKVSVDQHKLVIIATDGGSIEPYECKSFVIFHGERYDFVLETTFESGDFWMRVEGLDSCSSLKQSLAIIHYDTNPVKLPNSIDDSSSGPNVNPCVGLGDFAENDQYVEQLNLHPNVSLPTWPEPDETIYIEQTFADDNLHRFPRLNNVTFKLPPRPFLLHERGMKKIGTCSLEEHDNGERRLMKQCGDGFCECTHVIRVPQGKVVEIIFVNHKLDYNDPHFCHPIHLHGTHFRVVAEGSLPPDERCSVEYVKMLIEQGKIKRKDLSKAILKDTMVAPQNGYTIVQFKADNPGYWYMHCHYELHVEEGMVLVLHVDGDIPEKPEFFPECGNWPVPREDEGEVFGWSESALGHIDNVTLNENNPFYRAVASALEESKSALEERFHRKFDRFEVTNNRLKTEPIAGFHNFLFKINTGRGWFVHVQIKVATEYDDTPQPYIVACLDGLTDEHPLRAIKVTSRVNQCTRPIVHSPIQITSSARVYGSSFRAYSLITLALLLICVSKSP